MDLSILDRPDILEIIFPVVYSPFYSLYYLQSSPSDVPSYSIEVEEGIKIDCGFWVSGKECSSILYFHGNGETVTSHDWVAPFYNQRGINLFVADYRGYGSSNGKPTISNMIGDAHTIFKGFNEIIEKEGFKRGLFIMGRSLGSMPAMELAYNYQDDIRGLIIESGTANNFRRLWDYLGITKKEAILSEESLFLNKVKIKQVHKPTLIIHGEYDQIISVKEGEELHGNSGAQDKRLLIIPGADHNDVMIVKQSLYFDTIEKFIKAYS
ncbi:MAG TPA: alpha/beta hydrolase [Dehalococcoidia bacterium]|jgi:alpha-beta hydrolase superfamily lysophospholipase|nr:alpha/beta hydrolase [Dehalococcoidia bacterium]